MEKYPKCYIKYDNEVCYPVIKINWYSPEKYVLRYNGVLELVNFKDYIKNPNMDYRDSSEKVNNDLQIFLRHNVWLGKDLYDRKVTLIYSK